MTDYATSRDAAYAGRIQVAIEDFASQFELNAYSSVQRKTIFLFPGGIGSQLMRTYQTYPDPAQSFEKVWLDALGRRSSSCNAARGRRYRTEVCRS